MRHLISFFKSLFNRVSRSFSRARYRDIPTLGPDPDFTNAVAGGGIGQARSPRQTTKRESPKWWGGVAAWGIHGNEEFTKWWNHWMARIPHTGAALGPNRARKNDV